MRPWRLCAHLARQHDLLQLTGADALDGPGDSALVRRRLGRAGDAHLADRGRIEHWKRLVGQGAGRRGATSALSGSSPGASRVAAVRKVLPVTSDGELGQDEQRRRSDDQ